MNERINKGIQVSGGGAIHATNLAGGDHAQATFYANADPEKRELLDQIMQKLDALAQAIQKEQSLPNRQMVADSTASLKTELAKDKPNKLTVSAVLDGIAGAVKSVTGIATSVEALKLIITKLF